MRTPVARAGAAAGALAGAPAAWSATCCPRRYWKCSAARHRSCRRTAAASAAGRPGSRCMCRGGAGWWAGQRSDQRGQQAHVAFCSFNPVLSRARHTAIGAVRRRASLAALSWGSAAVWRTFDSMAVHPRQVLAELIESVHSAEEALGLGTGLEAHDEAGSSSAAAGPSRQQPLQPQPSTSRGGPGSSSCSTSSSGGANEERNQLAASVSAASSQGAAECFIWWVGAGRWLGCCVG